MPSPLVACQTKKGHYYSYLAAHQGAVRLFMATGEVTYPYKCPHCKLFHIGHSNQPGAVQKVGDWEDPERKERRRKEQAEERRASALRSMEENNERQAAESVNRKAEKARAIALNRRDARYDAFAVQRMEDDGAPCKQVLIYAYRYRHGLPVTYKGG